MFYMLQPPGRALWNEYMVLIGMLTEEERNQQEEEEVVFSLSLCVDESISFMAGNKNTQVPLCFYPIMLGPCFYLHSAPLVFGRGKFIKSSKFCLYIATYYTPAVEHLASHHFIVFAGGQANRHCTM
jgi:hypothetical protein